MSSPAASVAVPGGFGVADNQLFVGGIPLGQLADRVGSTPFYAYDRGLISQRMVALRRVLPRRLKLNYAVKANPMPAVVQHLAGLVDGFDVASAGELKVALDTPIRAADISFAGPGKREAELKQAVAAGVLLHVESEREIDALIALANNGRRPRVAIRVNPDFQVRGSGMRMGGGAQPFGIDIGRVPGALSRLNDAGLACEGFHVFAGSQNLHAKILSEAYEKTVDLILDLSRQTTIDVRHINIGGGFGIPYAAGDMPLDLADVARGLERQVVRLCEHLPRAAVVLELGRYIVGEAGIYVCRIIDRKESAGTVYLVTDGGMHQHLAASGNLGQVIRRNFPVAIGNRMSLPSVEKANVTGPLCTPLDVLAENLAVPAAEIGDLVVVFQSGAYGATASPRDFLSHPHPGEVLV